MTRKIALYLLVLKYSHKLKGHSSIDGLLTDDSMLYQYNELGRTKTMTPEGGQTVIYEYDYESSDPNIKKVRRLLNIRKGSDTFAYGYEDVNPLVRSLTRPNGSFTEYEYNDPLKRLAALINKKSSQELINSFARTYYTASARTDLVETETITNGEAIDNFVAGTKTYTNNNLNQTTATTNPNQTYTYDGDGNMTTGYTPEGYALTMTYDAENRMKSAEYADSNSVVHRTEYTYSGDSFLAEMKKFENGSLVNDTRYVRGGFLPIQERDGNNAITREYVWGQNLGGGIGGLLNLRQGGSDYAYLYDGKGNVSSLLDPLQTIVAAYAYDPFGVLMKKTALIDQPYMFSTKEYDPETGLSYFGYRFYNASTGKWTTRDPLGEAGGYNLYGFVGNSAMNWIDSWGLVSLETSISGDFTKFDPRPEDPEGVPLTIQTRVKPDSLSKKDAGGPFTSSDVYVVYKEDSKSYGPKGAYIYVDPKRQQNIHGGGSCPDNNMNDPLLPRQGWCKTRGCTRGQNEDVQELARRILDFQFRHPGAKIPYSRY